MKEITRGLCNLKHALLAVAAQGTKCHPDDAKIVRKIFKQFNCNLKALPTTIRGVFQDREQTAFNKVKELMTMLGMSSSISVSNSYPMGISISEIFEQFISGITYFQQDEPKDKWAREHPIYHRLFPCSLDINGRMQRRIIEQCYIERMIYYELINKVGLELAILIEKERWLEETSTAFHQCFLNIDIKVHLRVDGIIPVQVRIVKLFCKKPRKIWLYTKKWIGTSYEDETQLLLWNGKEYYINFSSFIHKGCPLKWKQDCPPNFELNPEKCDHQA